MSNLVASQIMSYADVPSRASAIEKWVAVADICRCLHNYNGVLEITSALNRSAIYRLKKTWAKVSKQVRGIWPWQVVSIRFHLILPYQFCPISPYRFEIRRNQIPLVAVSRG